MNFLFSLCLLGSILHYVAARPPILKHGEKIHECAQWFPADPCFKKSTLHTSSCTKPYKWKRNIQGMAEDVDFNVLFAGLDTMMGSSNLTVDHESTTDALSYAMSMSDINVTAESSQEIDYDGMGKLLSVSADLPCCQLSMPCYEYMSSLPHGIKLRDHPKKYHKWVCCFASWALGCGSKVPDLPAKLRPPPKCTMPKGHDPWAKKQ